MNQGYIQVRLGQVEPEGPASEVGWGREMLQGGGRTPVDPLLGLRPTPPGIHVPHPHSHSHPLTR